MSFKKVVLHTIWSCDDNKLINKFSSHIGVKRSKEFIEKIEKDFHISLHPDLHKFYEKIDGFCLEWNLKKRIPSTDFGFKNQIWGNINFYELKQIFTGDNEKEPWKDILWFDFDDDKEKLKLLRPFDLHNGDITSCACLKIDNSFVNNEVYYYDIEYGVNKMSINFLEYFEKAIFYKGFVNWQRAFISDDKKDITLIEEANKKLWK